MAVTFLLACNVCPASRRLRSVLKAIMNRDSFKLGIALAATAVLAGCAHYSPDIPKKTASTEG